ncbi:MAG: hypothetical protein HOE66_00495, partial [Planctomycetes bacterium]|nr:hypothetical protein [Planctomycetota bacterium]
MEETHNEKLVLGFVGTVSSGKSTAITKLFGIDVGDIDPLPGSTKKTKFFRHPELDNVIVGDLPGLGDVNAEVSEIAQDALKDLDLIVNVVNADGGIGDQEMENLRLIQKTEKPFVVCLNKIDLINPEEWDELRKDTASQLSLELDSVLLTAFDPDNADPGEMIGVGELNCWTIETLKEKGKHLLYLKSLKKEAPDEFDEQGFWKKVRKIAGKVPFIPDAVALYFCMMDSKTSLTTRIAIAGALAYLVWPADLI